MHARACKTNVAKWKQNKGGNIMTGKKLQRVLACLLAVLLLSQVGAFSPVVFAAATRCKTVRPSSSPR